MPEVTVRITRLLADIAGVGREISVSARSPAQALDELCTEIPALKIHIFEDDGAVRRHVNIFLNGMIVRSGPGLDTPVSDGDEVAVVQAVSGG